MSSPVAKTIQLLEQELDAIDQRRGEIQRAIDTLRPLAGDLDEIDAEVSSTSKAKKAQKRTDGARRAPAARSLPDDAVSDVGQKILAALKRGPLGSSALGEAVGLTGTAVLYHLKKLQKAKLIESTGNSNARVHHLPGKAPARRGL